MTEEDLIERYFKFTTNNNVLIGIGDDAAVIQSEKTLTATMDSLVEGQHFKADDTPQNIGHKSLAVNLSDLAAMGSYPKWALLSLSLPAYIQEDWVAGFAEGFMTLAQEYNVSLIGGDLVKGPLVITVQLTGEVSEFGPILRSGAKIGDDIYMTGSVGGAGVAWHRLHCLENHKEIKKQCLSRLQRPQARVLAGIKLAQFANAAIDISDGVLLDLSRILSASQLGGQLDLDKVVIDEGLEEIIDAEDFLLPFITGEDYELIFTVSPENEDRLMIEMARESILVTKIGKVEAGNRLHYIRAGKEIPPPKVLGFDHFSESAC